MRFYCLQTQIEVDSNNGISTAVHCSTHDDCDPDQDCCQASSVGGDDDQKYCVARESVVPPVVCPPSSGAQCTEDGVFEPKQSSRERGLCWCVDQCGHPIPGTHTPTPGSLQCEPVLPCQQGLNGSLPRRDDTAAGSVLLSCTEDGFYNHTQCLGAECWCVNRCGERLGISRRDCALLWRCGTDPCSSTTCDLYPQATCRVEEHCGICQPAFYIDDQQVACSHGPRRIEKNGVCPSPASLGKSGCPFECTDDADCLGDQKCCKPLCGTVCTDAVPRYHEGQCPVPWLPGCSIVNKSDHCMSDGQCSWSEKCCESGCGRQCTNTSWESGNKVTIGYGLTKAGQCPSIASMTCTTVFECTGDTGCGGNKKCCSNGCGTECIAPTTFVKYGLCPRVSHKLKSCSEEESVDECRGDEDCHGYRKCCNNGCRNVCLNPWKYGKPGLCPKTIEAQSANWTASPCSVDLDCVGDLKCCADPHYSRGWCLQPRLPIADYTPSASPTSFCYQDRRRYNHGDQWSPDPCFLCRCWAGFVECMSVSCLPIPERILPGCNVTFAEGQCCPEVHCHGLETEHQDCPTETGTNHSHSDIWNADPCTQCSCVDGEVTCTTRVCTHDAAVNSSGCRMLPQPGRCCPRVVCSGESPVPADYCLDLHGIAHFAGDRWKEDDCTTCICEDEKVKCLDRRHSCAALAHPSCHMREVKGQCCMDVVCPPEEFLLTCEQVNEICPASCASCDCANNTLRCILPAGDCEHNSSLCSARSRPHAFTECPSLICNKDPEKVCHQGELTYYSEESWAPDDCTACVCHAGLSVCQVVTCPDIRPGCLATFVQGRCCPDIRCKTPGGPAGCFHGNANHAEGDSWYEDACTMCGCRQGGVHCSKVECPALMPVAGCRLIHRGGACCPLRVCRPHGDGICSLGNATFPPGRITNLDFPTSSPIHHPFYQAKYQPESAQQCVCASGAIFCTAPACPAPQDGCTEKGSATSLSCPPLLCHIVKRGQCPVFLPGISSEAACAVECAGDSDCAGSMKCCKEGCSAYCRQSQPDQDAVHETLCVDGYGRKRSEGDIWYRDICTQCACVDSRVHCKTKECVRPPPGCQEMAPYEGDCCGIIVCPHTTERSCFHHSLSHSSGSYWYPDDCRTCRCGNGVEHCTSYQCLTTPQEGCVFRLRHNKCCPEKFCLPEKSCIQHDVVHQEGEMWYQSPCETCRCERGVATCHRISCPIIPTNQGSCTAVEGSNACCGDLSCSHEGNATCLYQGQTQREGEVWFTDPCTSCTCLSPPRVTCTTLSCPPLTVGRGCRAVPVQGQCCPEVVCRAVKSCMSEGGVEHLNHEVWQRDACTVCHCSEGQSLCREKSCPVPGPACRYSTSTSIPGQCCREIVCLPTAAKSCRPSPISPLFYLHNEVWSYDVCTMARCDDGAVIEARDRCPFIDPPPGCYLIAVQGQCCPHIDCSQGKEGQCPLQGSFPASSGLAMCGHDADCPGSKKCCYDGTSYSCISPLTITHSGECPPSFVTNLPVGQACPMACYSDQDCPRYEKCCASSGCGTACKRPIMLRNRRPLLNITGQICGLLENLKGSHLSTGKTGACPTFAGSEDEDRQEQPLVAVCANDRDCPGDEKCCPAKGFKMCLTPQLQEELVKAGECPAVRYAEGTCTRRVTECSVDRDCMVNRKCCYDGCAYRCLDPLQTDENAPCTDIQESCDRVCPEGFATYRQCEVCQCSWWCLFRPTECPFECPYGYATDLRGCKMCECKRAVKPSDGIGELLATSLCLPLNPRTCPLGCRLGFVTDSLGCKVCRCRDEDQACTPLEACGLYCPFGFATSLSGCSVCRCQQRDGTDQVFLPQRTPCQAVQCPNECPHGSATDRFGCPACAACLVQGEPADVMTQCPYLRCPYGFATDEEGKKTCKCRLPAACPALSSCLLTCDFGRLSDQHGCDTCACRLLPMASPDCPVLSKETCPEIDMCAYGLSISLVDGCEKCLCRTPATDCPGIARESCTLRCQRGFATDEKGCEICLCTKSDEECMRLISSHTCPKTCPFGLATDSRGCQVCACKIPILQPFKDPFRIESLTVTPCPPVTTENCALVCSEGYATDMGCEICACQQAEGCISITEAQCPLLATCPYGLATDRHGCSTCRCRQPIACHPISELSCSEHCPHGRATDSEGCEICNCRNTGPQCVAVHSKNCSKRCTYGYATDPVTLCQVCSCKQPTELPVAVTLFRLCEPAECEEDCPNGYLKDKHGCQTCVCRAEDVVCPALNFQTCPHMLLCPYGLGMNTDGCPVCFCQVEPGCYAVPLTCDLECRYGYATDESGCETCACRNFDPDICDLSISASCQLKCPYGLVTDGNGCEICKCKNQVRELSIVSLKPVVTCTPVQCGIDCEFGLANDALGCNICTCKQPITDDRHCRSMSEATCPLVNTCPNGLASKQDGCPVCRCKQSAACNPLLSCSLSCPTGLATDTSGCDVCACKNTSSACAQITVQTCPLSMFCQRGLATDSQRCEICRCKSEVHPELPPPMADIFATSSSLYHTSSHTLRLVTEVVHCAPLKCDLDCGGQGFATDAAGCQICRCTLPDFVCSTAPDGENCDRVHTCPFGLATDSNGCKLCVCKLPNFCPPVIESCDLDCDSGFATDQNGCEICRCKITSLDLCPVEMTSTSCPLTCPFGLATDQSGCEVCSCKVPATIVTTNIARTMGSSEIAERSPPHWIPTVVCPNMASCDLTCDQGYATNGQGCTICRCISAAAECFQSFNISQCPLLGLCSYGLATNEEACPLCKCRLPTPCPAAVPIQCRNSCPHGYASDEYGCPRVGQCACVRAANDPLCDPETLGTCRRACPHGYATDSNGCEICQCRMPFTIGAFLTIAPPSFDVFTQETVTPSLPYTDVTLVPESFCPLVDNTTCSLRCPAGLATDMRGCPICACTAPTESCVSLDPRTCLIADLCPFGLATGPSGCQVCICRQKMNCRPILPTTCSTYCPHGHAVDNFGCEVCHQCAEQVGKCLDDDIPQCSKHCSDDLVTDSNGCPLCRCRQPATHFPISSFVHSELLGLQLTTGCPEVICHLHCHHGYQMDAKGCGLCECISETSCDPPNCERKCPFGFVRDSQGCQTCSCKSAGFCVPVTPSTCSLTCNHGYATNIHGCDVCKCKKTKMECPDYPACTTPMMHCAFGLATDDEGCEVCMCKHQIASGFILPTATKPVHCPALNAASCDLRCDAGFMTDRYGCDLCECAPEEDDCPVLDDCYIGGKCPYGLARDAHGCITCSCKPPGICEPLPSYCDLRCEWGFSTDEFGCEVCQCKKIQECQLLESCDLTCPFGLATCPCRCDICKCKLPDWTTVNILADMTAVPLANESSPAEFAVESSQDCPELYCLQKCFHGYETDPITGCLICQCKPRMRCPALHEPKSVTETICESMADCESPLLCCYTGSRFMCVKSVPDTCTDNFGQVHNHGDVWYEECGVQSSCYHGNIQNGQFEALPIPEGCSAEFVPGHCYPSYVCADEACTTGATWSINACTNCSCEAGRGVCTTLPCPEVPHGCQAAPVSGSCCPDVVCPGCVDSVGRLMAENQMWNEDFCTSCLCLEGQRSCRRVTCEVPRPDCRQVFLPNQCCPQIECPAEIVRPCEAVRSFRNPQLLLDETPTYVPPAFIPSCNTHGHFNTTQCYPAQNVCWCSDHLGREIDNTRTKYGVPTCRDDGCVDQSGTYRRENETWSRDRCTLCRCILGLVVCQGPACRTPPEGCSPIAGGPECGCPLYVCSGFCFDEQHNIRRRGELWTVGPCTQCECFPEGVISCRQRDCAAPPSPPEGCVVEERSNGGCCASIVVCYDAVSECPQELPVALCESNPCHEEGCPGHPNAVCHANFCGGCRAIFYDELNVAPVNCSQGTEETGPIAVRARCIPLQEQTTATNETFYPRCTAHGTFSPKQCNAFGTCWCVDSHGNVLPDQNEMTAAPNEFCVEAPCRREQESTQIRANLGQPVTSDPQCDADGMYAPRQCTASGDRCWCSEPDGTVIPNSERAGGDQLECSGPCGDGREPLVALSCNSLLTCPLGYYCRFQTSSNHGACCPHT